MTNEFRHLDLRRGLIEEGRQDVYDEIFELTTYLLNEYKNSGKTFVIKNWESDNHVRLFELPEAEWRQAIEGMIDWVNTRQRAVSDARAAAGMDGVAVYHAFEVVRIPVGRDFGHPTMLEAVVPQTNCDLYSYSNWAFNRRPGNEGLLLELLDTIAAVTPPSKLFGHRNLFLGEWGTYEVTFMTPLDPAAAEDTRVHDARSDRLQREVAMRNLDLALGWGVRYALYWQLYCNGLRDGVTLARDEPASEEQLTGVWLIRPGSKALDVPPSRTSTWDALAELMKERFLFDDLSGPERMGTPPANVEFRDNPVDYHPTDPFRAGRLSVEPAQIQYSLAEDLRDFNIRFLHDAPTGDLIGYWPLDEWEGDRAYDKSGFGNDGSRLNGAGVADAAAPAGFDNSFAATFGGTAQINIPASEHYAVRDWTVAGWLSVPADLRGEGDRAVVSREESSVNRQFWVGVSETTGQLMAAVSDAGRRVAVPSPAEDLRGTGWRSFVLISDAGKVRLYLDVVGSPAVEARPDLPLDQPIRIGAGRNGGGIHGYWRGQIDDIRFYKRALGDEEIARLWESPPAVLADLVRIRVSATGREWKPVPFQATYTRRMNDRGILSSFLRPVGNMPDGIRFFEVAWKGESPAMPEIGSVALRTGN